MNLTTFWIGYSISMISILSIVFFLIIRKIRGSIRVRVKTPLGEREYWRKPNRAGTHITVFDGKKKKQPEWTFKLPLKALYFTKKLFMRALTVDVFSESDEAITYDYETKDFESPKFTKEKAREWTRSRGLTQYLEGPREKLTMITLIMLAMLGANLVLTMLLLMRF